MCAHLFKWKPSAFNPCLTDTVCFEDETEQTASDYHVVSAEASPTVPRGMRKARFSTSTSTIPSIPSPTQAFLPDGARRISNPRTLSLDSLMPPDTPRDNPKLADFNEAFLLRHFQRTLGPWVCSLLRRQLDTNAAALAGFLRPRKTVLNGRCRTGAFLPAFIVRVFGHRSSPSLSNDKPRPSEYRRRISREMYRYPTSRSCELGIGHRPRYSAGIHRNTPLL
jgi:hypothetical protein